MTWKFQVRYRIAADNEARAIEIKAGTPEEAVDAVRGLFPEHVMITNVGPGESESPVAGLTRDQQKHFFQCSDRKLDEMKESGDLPRPKSGRIDLVPLETCRQVHAKIMGLQKAA